MRATTTAPHHQGAGQGRLRRAMIATCERAVAHGAPPAWFGWRRVREESLDDYFARGGAGRLDTIHPEMRTTNPLPMNVADTGELPDDPDWFGFSFRDVPQRRSGRTALATLPDASVVTFNDAERNHFWPALLTRDATSLHLREMRFRPGHGSALRTMPPPVRIDRATWILERVYDNHSHWLTAHLPKLCLLKRRGGLGDVILPARRNAVIDASLRMLGIDPARHHVHDPARPLRADELTVLETDRFRPELLRPVRDALGAGGGAAPWRRVFISRARAAIRKLANEDEIAPLLTRAGFEAVHMEDLSFDEQIRLMGETRVLLAPHGAGLTNMMFCPEGAHIVEMADISYPNPNFYALAAAMGHHYWLVRARFVPDDARHRLRRDLTVDPARVREILKALETVA